MRGQFTGAPLTTTRRRQGIVEDVSRAEILHLALFLLRESLRGQPCPPRADAPQFLYPVSQIIVAEASQQELMFFLSPAPLSAPSGPGPSVGGIRHTDASADGWRVADLAESWFGVWQDFCAIRFRDLCITPKPTSNGNCIIRYNIGVTDFDRSTHSPLLLRYPWSNRSSLLQPLICT